MVKDTDLLLYSVVRAVLRRAVFLLLSTVKLTYTYHPLTHIIGPNLFTFNSWRHYKIIWRKLTNSIIQNTMALVQAANQNCRNNLQNLFFTSRHPWSERDISHEGFTRFKDFYAISEMGSISLFHSSSQKKTSLRLATFKGQQVFDMDSSWTEHISMGLEPDNSAGKQICQTYLPSDSKQYI